MDTSDRHTALPRLISIEEAALRLDISKATAYRAIKDDTFPLPIIQIGGRLKVSLAALQRLLNGEVLCDTTGQPYVSNRYQAQKQRKLRPDGPRQR